jgi:hypothetical protein
VNREGNGSVNEKLLEYDRHFSAEESRKHFLENFFTVSPARPSDKNNMKANTLECIEIVA